MYSANKLDPIPFDELNTIDLSSRSESWTVKDDDDIDSSTYSRYVTKLLIKSDQHRFNFVTDATDTNGQMGYRSAIMSRILAFALGDLKIQNFLGSTDNEQIEGHPDYKEINVDDFFHYIQTQQVKFGEKDDNIGSLLVGVFLLVNNIHYLKVIILSLLDPSSVTISSLIVATLLVILFNVILFPMLSVWKRTIKIVNEGGFIRVKASNMFGTSTSELISKSDITAIVLFGTKETSFLCINTGDHPIIFQSKENYDSLSAKL